MPKNIKRTEQIKMSDLFDKRSSGAKQRRDERTQKEKIARDKSKRTAVIITSVVVVVFAVALLINSGFIRRQMTAVTVDGVSFSAAEFDFFYNRAFFDYHEFIHTHMPDIANVMLPTPHVPLASQVQNTDTGATWADFFAERAIANMAELAQLYNAARASGFVMSQEDIDLMEDQFAMIMQEGEMAVMLHPHIYRNPMSRVRENYGSGLNESTLRDILTFIFTASAYGEHRRESLEFAEAQLEAFYNESRDDFDIFSYRLLLVEPETVDPLDFDVGEGEAFADAQEAAEEEVVRRASEIAESIVSQEDFIEAARGIDEFNFADERSTFIEQQGQFLHSNFRDWLVDDARFYGDVTMIEQEYGIYILFFIERDDNNYRMTSMRQILLMREDVNPWEFDYGEDDPEFIEAFEASDAQARERGEAALAVFEVGGASEAQLIDMMEDFSDDPTEGGLYEDIARFPFQSERVHVMRIVPELEEWLFDEARQVGDYELIRTEAFGYHLMFFHGHGELFRHFIAAEGLRTRDHTQWLDDFPEASISRHWAFTLTQA